MPKDANEAPSAKSTGNFKRNSSEAAAGNHPSSRKDSRLRNGSPRPDAEYSAKENKPIRLSPTSGLSLYQNCPRCFWLHFNKKIQRPRGIFPSLPGGMDLVIKKYFDNYRGKLPPELKGKVDGNLISDNELIKKWRAWQTRSLEYFDKGLNAVLFGALDDCLVDNDHYIPLDYKTRGSAPKSGDSERYYRTQLDTYTLLLSNAGYKVKNHAYLVYYYPEEVKESGAVKFNIQPVKVETDTERVKALFNEAIKTLKSSMPPHSSECEYCSYIASHAGL
jgi:CRISPR/Cas system-associated exonuclease Cas4 (RecB family)